MRLFLKASLIGLLFLFYASLNSTVLAQGTYTCQVSGSSCGVKDSCDSGYEPAAVAASVCGGFDADQCAYAESNLSFDCFPEGAAGFPGVTTKSGPAMDCEGHRGFTTAIGCIPLFSTDSQTGIALFFLSWGMGLGGGVALILMVIATYMIMTSAGDPRKLQAGKELLTSAVTGLLLLIFSAYILRFVGVDLLGVFSS